MSYIRFLDEVLIAFDHAAFSLRTSRGVARSDEATTHPGVHYREAILSRQERHKVAALMRVNHAGEIAAQGLYLGQARMARDHAVREHMQQSAREEGIHLLWCRQRLRELEGRTSILDPAWFLGSWLIGLMAGRMGEEQSLGFLEETERQVVQHLDRHLQRLPTTDQRSRAILRQMQEDEARHADAALQAGGQALSCPARAVMRATAQIMTRVAYYL